MSETTETAYVCAHCSNYMDCVKKKCAGVVCKKFLDVIHDLPSRESKNECLECGGGFID